MCELRLVISLLGVVKEVRHIYIKRERDRKQIDFALLCHTFQPSLSLNKKKKNLPPTQNVKSRSQKSTSRSRLKLRYVQSHRSCHCLHTVTVQYWAEMTVLRCAFDKRSCDPYLHLAQPTTRTECRVGIVNTQSHEAPYLTWSPSSEVCDLRIPVINGSFRLIEERIAEKRAKTVLSCETRKQRTGRDRLVFWFPPLQKIGKIQ